jgi:hypothetical protein
VEGEIMDMNTKSSEGLQFALSKDGASYILTGIGNCKDKNIIIPATYNGKPVTGIAEWAFFGCKHMESVTIPACITYIDDWAFASCTSLRDVIVSEGLKYIGDWAFSDCSSLTSITIPKSVERIGVNAYYCCPIESVYCAQEPPGHAGISPLACIHYFGEDDGRNYDTPFVDDDPR